MFKNHFIMILNFEKQILIVEVGMTRRDDFDSVDIWKKKEVRSASK